MVLYASRMTDSRTSNKYILLGIFFLLSLSIHEFTHVFEKDDAHHQEVIGLECDVCEYNETDFADNSHSPIKESFDENLFCLLYTSPSPRDQRGSRVGGSA